MIHYRGFFLFFLLVILSSVFPESNKTSAQGSWLPPGHDPSFPRTYPDSLMVPVIRNTLTDPEIFYLYGSAWLNAFSAIPSGNSSVNERYVRSVLAREASFIVLMDRKFSANQILPLPASDRDTLLNRALNLLNTMNTDVDVGSFWTFYNPWQNRSKELISYLIAYDLLKGAGISDLQLSTAKTRLITFTTNLYQKAMASYTILGLKFFTYQFNNHSIMTASALGLAAVVLNDYSSSNINAQPVNWINAGLYNLDNTLWIENGSYPRVSEPDTLAGYAEGPNYFKYGFENAFPFIGAMGNFLPDAQVSTTFNGTTRLIPNPWYDERYDGLYDWMNKIRMPDGSFPAIHDSYMGFGTTIMALSGKSQYNWTNPGFNANDPMVRTQYIATNVAHGAIADCCFQSLPAAGSLVFRSSWNPDAVYMHFIGKHGIALTGAKSHHQGDASSFSMAAFGELLAIDPGYPGSSQASLTNKAVDHNLVLVNGTGPLPPSGELVSTSTNTAFIENCFDTPLLDYGEVEVNYSGAEIIRKTLFVRNKYFLLSDFCTSSSPKSYTFQLHGNGLAGQSPTSPTGAFMQDFTNNRGIWQRNGVSLLTVVENPGSSPVFSYTLDSMVISGGFRRYSRMLAQKSNMANHVFLTALHPFSVSAPSISRGMQHDQAAIVSILSEGYHDLVIASHSGTVILIPEDSSGFDSPVTGNGKINLISETVGGEFSSAFLHDGDTLALGSQTLISANLPANIAWMLCDSIFYAGYISDTGVVRLFSTGPCQVLQGNVQCLAYNAEESLLLLHVSEPGNFSLGATDLTWIWSGSTDSLWHEPGNWNLAGHEHIHGVPLPANSVKIPGDATRMPVIDANETAECHHLTIGTNAMLWIRQSRWLVVNGTLTISN